MRNQPNNLSDNQKKELIATLSENNADRFVGETCYACLTCANAFSTDNDELVCVLKDSHKIVAEDYLCQDWI